MRNKNMLWSQGDGEISEEDPTEDTEKSLFAMLANCDDFSDNTKTLSIKLSYYEYLMYKYMYTFAVTHNCQYLEIYS